MKHSIGYLLLIAGIADALYMYSSGLTGQVSFFSVNFALMIATFIVINFFAVLLLSEPKHSL